MQPSEVKQKLAIVLRGGGNHESWLSAKAAYPRLSERDYLAARQAYLELSELPEQSLDSLREVILMIETLIAQNVLRKRLPDLMSNLELVEQDTVSSAPQEEWRIESLIDQLISLSEAPRTDELEIRTNIYNALRALGARALPHLQPFGAHSIIRQLISDIEQGV